MSVSQNKNTLQFEVKNIGGIDQTSVKIPPGVTVLTGENATNRTSFLQAIMAVMGSNQATLKGDADNGHVRLSVDDMEYERTLTRSNGSVTFSGNGYLDDPPVADLFAFLHEMNRARQGVVQGNDLREIIMQPVDVEAIKREIEHLESEKSDINDELATIESRKRDLTDLEQRRTTLRDQIETKREALAAKEEEIDQSSRDIKESRKVKEELEAKLEKLRSVRSELASVRRDIESQEDSIASLKQERSDLKSELAALPETPMADHQDLDGRISRLREQRQELSSEISELQSIIQYNNERLDEEDYELLDSLDESATDDDAITDQLLEDESIVCWTCGSTVDREQIEATIDRLQDLRQQKVVELNDIKSDLEDLKDQQRELEQTQQRRQRIEQKLTQIDDEIDRREAQMDSLKDHREELTVNVEELEREVDELEAADFDEILDLHREANQLEFEIDDLESELDTVTAEIEEIEELVDRAETLRKQRDEILEQLEDQRTKIEQIEQEAIEQFNDHMDSILGLLAYENLERIWIERVKRTVQDGRQTVERPVFELHVVRTTENGTAYEDRIEHLSESEREVTSLIFALAGYLVHDLHETVPVMLLDSLEAIDSDRIAKLVTYFADYADYLVVALLPEDAQALEDDYTRITSI